MDLYEERKKIDTTEGCESLRTFEKMTGADNRSRTYDLRITNALLYQLSYIGPEEGCALARGKRL